MKCIYKTLVLILISSTLYAQKSGEFKGIESSNEEIELRYRGFARDSYDEARDQPKSQYRSEIKQFYKARYKSTIHRLENGHYLLNPEMDNYLRGIKSIIGDANPSFDFDEVEILVTRYYWPNAFSLGDGTLAINIGLLTKLENEAQLAFVICHEASHFFLNHADKDFIRRFETINSVEFQQQMEDINNSEFYQTTKLKELIKSNIYSERNHSRQTEFQADSLGLIMYLNAGYPLQEVVRTLEILDKLNEPEEYNLNLFEILKIDTVEYPKSSLKVEDAYKNDILHDDSVRTHPDCQQRIEVIKGYGSDGASRMSATSPEYGKFAELVQLEEVHSMLYFSNYSDALLVSLKKLAEGVDTAKNKTAIIIIMERLVTARKDHSLGQYLTKPNDDKANAENDLANIVFALRYKILAESVFTYAQSLYHESLKDESTLISMIMLARLARDGESFNEYKAEYMERFSTSWKYTTIKRLEL